MNDERCLALLRLLAARDGISLHVGARQLGWSLSEMHRVLAALGDDPAADGLGLVELRDDGDRRRIHLTARGRALGVTA